jgi:hypothetical protein
MYLNTYAFDHVWYRETRARIAVMMGASMPIIMLGFMLRMYPNKRAITAIFIGSILAFATLGSQPRDGRRCLLH